MNQENNLQIQDPSSRYDPIPGLERIVKDKILYEEKKKKKQDEKKKNFFDFFTKLYGTQIGLALLTSGISLGILYIVNPPLSQQKRRDRFSSEKQSWQIVLIICVIIFLIVLVGPEIVSFFRYIFK